ncbi:hypothetical protein DES35_101464 [Schleiferia thermophila]|uniref:Uncharacterized protein n=1 Tax=Schleiferia thermophila TaxID=884107 RepID=A0A369A7T0_9FLAO|nr:hypothetical protein DES35_101464 [Schleiferia thermophila]
MQDTKKLTGLDEFPLVKLIVDSGLASIDSCEYCIIILDRLS